MGNRSGPGVTRRFLLQALLAGAAGPALARAPLISERPPRGRHGMPQPGAEALVDSARLKGDVVFAVADARSGEILEARHRDTGTAPASVTKTITALYALDTLGPAHRFRTQVLATGVISNGVVRGDLVLVGGGDPTTDTEALAKLAAGLKAAGIQEVRGGFLIWEGPIPRVTSIDPEQPDHVGYSPAVSGIALNFNRVHFEWRRTNDRYALTMDARAGIYRPEVAVARMTIADRAGPVYTYTDAGDRDDWTVARGALGRDGSRWLPVRHPGLYAGEVFATLARSHGIKLKAGTLCGALPEGRVLAEIESAPLSEILHGMLEHSNNLIAEMVGLASTLSRRGPVETLAASAAEMNAWAQARLGMQDPAFADHSGLGSASRVSAADMVRGLGAVGHAELLRPLLKPVQLLDGKGRKVHDHAVKAEAKTGTLNFVSGLAGYITTPGGRDLVFAVFAADEATRATLDRDEREKPPGGQSYASRARRLQRELIMRWGQVFSEPPARVHAPETQASRALERGHPVPF